MAKPVKMRCTVSIDHETSWMYRVKAVMFDGTPFSFKTERYNVECNENITPENQSVQGWVLVTHVAQQGNQVYITLPSPTIEHGKNLHVEELSLMPIGVTIDNFKTRTF